MERVRVLDKDGAEETLDEAFRMTQADIAEPANACACAGSHRVATSVSSRTCWFCSPRGETRSHTEWNTTTVARKMEWNYVSSSRPKINRMQTTWRAALGNVLLAPRRCHDCHAAPREIDRCLSLSFLHWSCLSSLWRLWFNWGDTSGIQVHLLTVKNGLWGFGDLLTILACGNEDATIMGYAPAAMISRFLAGHVAGAIHATGPGALTAKVTKYAQKAAKSDLLKLELKLEFLKQEQCLSLMRHEDKEVLQMFDDAIREVTKTLDDRKNTLGMLHT